MESMQICKKARISCKYLSMSYNVSEQKNIARCAADGIDFPVPRYFNLF